jgi:hydroxypyruvate isomerase
MGDRRWAIAANISLLFGELPLLERPAAAAAAGFDGVEAWWPFQRASPSARDIESFLAAIEQAGIPLIALNFAAGDMAAGERGLLADPQRTADFRSSVEVAVHIATATGCQRFNALYGNHEHDLPREQQHEHAARNLTWASDRVRAVGGMILVEAVNAVENPLYLLPRAADAARVVESARNAGHDNVGLLADIYHWALAGDNPGQLLRRYAALVSHVQIADVPGRHEPGTGSINFAEVWQALDEIEYRGLVAAEYRPKGATAHGLSWLNWLTQKATAQ